jgi:hypothetical protein
MMEVFDQFAQFVSNRYPFNSTRRTNGPTSSLSNIPVPVRAGEPDTTLSIEVLDEENAIVRPYPFSMNPFRMAFVGKVLPKRAYGDRAEFLRAYYSAVPLVATHTLHASK